MNVHHNNQRFQQYRIAIISMRAATSLRVQMSFDQYVSLPHCKLRQEARGLKAYRIRSLVETEVVSHRNRICIDYTPEIQDRFCLAWKAKYM